MKHNATGGQDATPPWGVRPAHPLDVSAQPPLVAATCVAAGVPLLGVPSLGDAPAEAIDGRTLRYLLKVNLTRKKKEEEEEQERNEEKEHAAETRRRAQALLDHAASLPKRKRKNKRKRKLPRNSSLPRSRRLFGTNSTLSLREGGPWLLRSILAASCPHGCLQAKMPGILVDMDQNDIYAATQRPLSLLALCALGNLDFPRATGIWQLLVRCLSRRRSTGKFGVFWEMHVRNYFYGPMYLAFTCWVYFTTLCI